MRIYSRFPSSKRGFFDGPEGAVRFGLLLAVGIYAAGIAMYFLLR